MTGPKPSGPTHPTPTHPPKGNGHTLPPLEDSAAPVRGNAVGGAGSGGTLPDLSRLVDQATLFLKAAMHHLSRQYDPESVPWSAGDPLPAVTDVKLAQAVADTRSALVALDELARGLKTPVMFTADHPACVGAGEAVRPAPSPTAPPRPVGESTDAPPASGHASLTGPRDVSDYAKCAGAGQPFASGAAYLAAPSVQPSLMRRSR